ncbi:MAG: hypothetical protein HYW49_01370 [Deltaproteobacteria bacterium]|nr:hypothetical protein [Deltaproteobacteria bacterium]
MSSNLQGNLKNYRDWYARVYPELTGHGLWLRGEEINTLAREEFEKRPLRVLFARLSTYFDTGYSFTHQILYQIAANTPGVFPDLSYLPPKQDAAAFARENIPWFLGTKTKHGPEAFDLIGISNSIVQELINLPSFLAKSGIPLKKCERMARADLPLIILGGANALYSTCLWSENPLVDGVFVGESDAALRGILEICRDGKAAGKSKGEILAGLESIDGFIQPENPRATKKSFIPNLNQSEALENGPVYYIEEQLGNSHLQISEGCPCFCSFCAESWDRKPYRERGAAELREVALRAKAAMGLDRIDIYSFNFNMHSGLYEILWDLVPGFRGVGLKSQRFDLLAHDPRMVEFQHAIEKASLTCGLEGISARLRKYLHKNLEPGQLHKSLTAIFKSKARELKVFLIATGLEEEQDFIALEDLLDRLGGIRAAAHATTRVIFSMTPLVRFPWTPLEFENAPHPKHYEKIIAKAAAKARAAGFEFRESANLPEYWVSQLLARSDRPAITQALLDSIARTGFVYYREVTPAFMGAFETALRARGLDPEALLKGFTLEESRSKPWARIETGVKREFLWQEVQRARVFVETDYCLGRAWTKAKCFHCGGCPTRFHARDIVLSRQKREYSLEQFKVRVQDARKAERIVEFEVSAGEAARGVPRKMLGVALARALMLSDSALPPLYRGYAGSFWSQDEKPAWVTGADLLRLKWNEGAIELLSARLRDPAFVRLVNREMGGWGSVKGILGADGFARAAPAGFPGILRLESPYDFNGDATLKALGLKHTLKKLPDGSYDYALIPASLKKGVFARLVVRRRAKDGCEVIVAPGPKLDVQEFVRRSFRVPTSNHRVRVRIHAEGTWLGAANDAKTVAERPALLYS